MFDLIHIWKLGRFRNNFPGKINQYYCSPVITLPLSDIFVTNKALHVEKKHSDNNKLPVLLVTFLLFYNFCSKHTKDIFVQKKNQMLQYT